MTAVGDAALLVSVVGDEGEDNSRQDVSDPLLMKNGAEDVLTRVVEPSISYHPCETFTLGHVQVFEVALVMIRVIETFCSVLSL